MPIILFAEEEETMTFESWQLAMMEEYGQTNTSDGLISRVARRLAGSPNDTIDTAEFRSVCIP